MSTFDILYVDDDPDIRTIVEMALGLDPGVAVQVAASGEEALALAGKGAPPDVALLDVMMPGMDGPTLMDRLHDQPHNRDVPVIFMTARARRADVDAYRDRGAIGVIVKPFDPIRLVAEIRALVEAHGARRNAGAG